MTDVNDPDLVALLAELHDAYERALTVNDVEALTRFFWDSPHVVRYGIAEQLYGADELRVFRQAHAPPFTDRRIVRRQICTFGPSCATVMSEIELVINGVKRRNRQSQTWAAFPGVGWRIVAAHVSAPLVLPAGQPWAVYADATSLALGLPLSPEHRPGVVANLQRTAAIVSSLLSIPLPDDEDPAPVFRA